MLERKIGGKRGELEGHKGAVGVMGLLDERDWKS